MALADLVVVMDKGRIEQAGPPREVYNKPATPFVARFIGGHNVLTGRVEGNDDGATLLKSDQGARYLLPCPIKPDRKTVSFAVRTDKISVSPAALGEGTTTNVLPATVRSVEYQGTWVQLDLEAKDVEEFTVSLHESTFFESPVAVGDQVVATWTTEHTHVLE